MCIRDSSWDIPTNKERDDTNLKIFFEQIKTLGPSGLIRLYINKTLTNYNDGSFAFNNLETAAIGDTVVEMASAISG